MESARRSISHEDKTLIGLPFRVEDDIAALFGRGLVGATVEEAVGVGVVVALLAATTEVEAAELLLLLGFLVVVGKVVGFVSLM